MIKAFVFGKFLPFHKGHEALIHFALKHCDYLSVLVCSSDREDISGEVRRSWILSSFNEIAGLHVQVLDYKENDLPNTSESSREVSSLWAVRFKALFPDYTLLVTSEPYGDYVAAFMGIRHILFDKERKMVPISATALRENMYANWNYLPAGTKRFFCITVTILGTESTGKTTLAEQLACHYQGTLVTEAGRDVISDSNTFSYEDLVLVAREHTRRVNEAVNGPMPLVILDTDTHITRSYSRFKFGRDLAVEKDPEPGKPVQLYLYLNNDVPFIQDGTRLNLNERNSLDASHRLVLKECDIDFIEIAGNWDERFNKAVRAINSVLKRFAIR